MNRVVARRTSLLVALAAAGCAEGGPVAPTLTVERYDSARGCYETCPGSPEPSAALPLEQRCGSVASACGFAGGVDRMRVVADYGDLDFSADRVVDPPTLTLTLDGVDRAAERPLAAQPRAEERVYFQSTFLAPAQRADALRLTARGAEGFADTIGGLSISAPELEVHVDGCEDGMPCSRMALVGKASLTVRAPRGLEATQFTVVTKLDDLPQQGSGPFDLLPGPEGYVEGNVSLPVPAGTAAGSLSQPWTLQVDVGPLRRAVTIDLAPLTFQFTVPACDPAPSGVCEATASQSVTAVITAPHGINAQVATVTYTLDGVPSGQVFERPFTIEDVDTRSAVFSPIPVPSQVGATWVLTGRIGQYSSQAPALQIAP